MAKAQQRLLSQSYRRHRQQRQEPLQQQTVPPYQGLLPILQFLGLNPQQLLNPSLQQCPKDEPAEPLSSQTTVTPVNQKLADFFRWCVDRPEWSDSDADLDELRVVLTAQGYDLKGIRSLSAAEWQSHELKAGLRKRIQSSVDKFEIQRKR